MAILDRNSWSRRALRSQVTHWTRQVFALAEASELIRLIIEQHLQLSTLIVNLGPGGLDEQTLETLSTIRVYYPGPVLLLAPAVQHGPPTPPGTPCASMPRYGTCPAPCDGKTCWTGWRQ